MPTLIKDFRRGAWRAARTPGFTVVAGLALAAGWVNLISPRSQPAPGHSVHELAPEKFLSPSGHAITPANYPDSKSHNRVFGDLAAVVDIFHMHLTGAGEPEELRAAAVSANFFQRIGVQPVIGRAFQPAEEIRGRDRVVILSHQLWRRRFDGNVGILGKIITLSGETYQVIGVLPEDFSWNNRRTDVWVPYVFEPGGDSLGAGGRYTRSVGFERVNGVDRTILRRRLCV